MLCKKRALCISEGYRAMTLGSVRTGRHGSKMSAIFKFSASQWAFLNYARVGFTK